MLSTDKYKDIVVESLKYLAGMDKIRVYGYVVMPNPIHLIWELLDLDGKEMPHAGFMKYQPYHLRRKVVSRRSKTIPSLIAWKLIATLSHFYKNDKTCELI